MAGKGKWTLQSSYRNCGNCPQCKVDSSVKPHGPYVQLRRRNPLEANRQGKQDYVYLGKIEVTTAQLQMINAAYSGPDVPTGKEVKELIGVI